MAATFQIQFPSQKYTKRTRKFNSKSWQSYIQSPQFRCCISHVQIARHSSFTFIYFPHPLVIRKFPSNKRTMMYSWHTQTCTVFFHLFTLFVRTSSNMPILFLTTILILLFLLQCEETTSFCFVVCRCSISVWIGKGSFLQLELVAYEDVVVISLLN